MAGRRATPCGGQPGSRRRPRRRGHPRPATTRPGASTSSSLLLTLGAAFVGVGIIWLVASNLDQLNATVRFAVVAAFWLTFLIGGELLARGPPPGR